MGHQIMIQDTSSLFGGGKSGGRGQPPFLGLEQLLYLAMTGDFMVCHEFANRGRLLIAHPSLTLTSRISNYTP